MSENICCIDKCKNNVGIFYYGKPLCDKHWSKLCEKSTKDMKKELNIKEPKPN